MESRAKLQSRKCLLDCSQGRSPEKKTALLLDFVQITSLPLPNLDNLYNFFSDVEIQDLKVSSGLKILLYNMYVYFYSTPSTEGVESTRGNSVCVSVCLFVRNHFFLPRIFNYLMV